MDSATDAYQALAALRDVVDTSIAQLREENKMLIERVAALERIIGGRAIPGGADLGTVEMSPKAPASLRKIMDSPQA